VPEQEEAPEFVEWDEAARCPECKQQGELLFSNAVIGGTLHTLVCRTKTCSTEGLRFMVQTDVNGKIPVNKEAWAIAHGRGGEVKSDPEFDRMHERVHEALQRQLDEETNGQ
jgi:hypothetical protein